MSSSITKKRPDGSIATADILVDTAAGTVTQVGGDAEITAEDIDLVIAMMTTPHEGDTQP